MDMRIAGHIRKYDMPQEIVKKKLRWFGHVANTKAEPGESVSVMLLQWTE